MNNLLAEESEYFFENVVIYSDRLWQSCLDTFLMFIFAGLFTFVFGLALGVLLTVTKKGGIKPIPAVYHTVDIITNIFRSIPFLILLIFLIPFTRWLVRTSIGVVGAIVPLVFGATPFFTRQVETALANVHPGKIEAARSMGSGVFGIIFRVYLHEAVPELIRGTTITAISLIGLTTMAGAVGAGGIGSFAINFGANLNHMDIVLVCVLILLVFICALQWLGSFLAKRATNRKIFSFVPRAAKIEVSEK